MRADQGGTPREGQRGAIRPIAVLVISAVLLLAAVVAVSAARDAGSEADLSRRAQAAGREPRLASQAKSSPVSERCLKSLMTVETAGLTLRDDTEFRCPATAAEPGEEHHWGATCWQNELCPGRSYIAVDEALIGSDDARLRYVIAHEICHVNAYTQTGEPGSEPAADECAAAAGFARPGGRG